MPTIRAILFDLDNTLVDFIEMKQESCRAAAGAMVAAGLPIDKALAYEELIKIYFAVGIESDCAFSEFLKSKGQFDHKILAAAINAYLDAKNKCLKPYANVKPVLEELQRRGIFICVVTDAPKTKAYQRLLAMGIEPYFRFVVGYEDTNNLKNTGLPLRLALQLLRKELPSIVNSEILMVGDSTERDVIPAKQLGLRTAWARYGQKTSSPSTADYELEDIKDLASIV
jgi:putative hydrolase of the HAD superfamily